MIENDTIKLLRECDAGVKMGIASIKDVLDYVKSEDLKTALSDCKDEHQKLEGEIEKELGEHRTCNAGEDEPKSFKSEKYYSDYRRGDQGDRNVEHYITGGSTAVNVRSGGNVKLFHHLFPPSFFFQA